MRLIPVLLLSTALSAQISQYPQSGGGGGSGTVTSVGLVGTSNQIGVTGCTSPITTSGSCTFGFTATPVMPNGTTATTQTTGDSTTKLATDGFVATALGGYMPWTGAPTQNGSIPVWILGSSAFGTVTGFYWDASTGLHVPSVGGGNTTFTGNVIAKNIHLYQTAGGTANAQTLTNTPAITVLQDGDYYCFLPNAANTTTAPTLQVDSTTQHTVVLSKAGGALHNGDYSGSHPACVIYNLAATVFELQNPQVSSGGGGGSQTLLGSYPASSSAELDAITRNSSGQSGAIFQSDFDEYVFELVNLVPSNSSVHLLFQVSTNGGSSWVTAANNYFWAGVASSTGGTGAVGAHNDSSITLDGAAGSAPLSNSAALGGLMGSFRVFDPLSGTHATFIYGGSVYTIGSGAFTIDVRESGYYTATTAVNAFRVLTSDAGAGGTISSGNLRVYGICKTSCGSSGGGSSSGVGVTGYTAPAATYSGTVFLPPSGGVLASSTESDVSAAAPNAGSIPNFSAKVGTAPGTGNSLAFTWRKAGVDQAVACTISNAATSCSDSAHSFSFSSGDLIDVKVIATGTPASTTLSILWGTFGSGSGSGYCYGPVNQTLSSTASSVTFSSIPSGCTNLVLKLTARDNSAGTSVDNLNVQFNGDTGSNYSWSYIQSNGASAPVGGTSASTTSGLIGFVSQNGNTAGESGSSTVTIFNYAATVPMKNYSGQGSSFSDTNNSLILTTSGTWKSTAAITSLSIIGGTFLSGSTFTLYGEN